MTATRLKPVAADLTQLDRTRELADAMAEADRIAEQLRDAQAVVDEKFRVWAADRSISRDEARAQLVSTGYLPRRRVWE